MNHGEWLEWAEIYALGALDGEELAQFEAHLAAGCPACTDRLRETRQLATLLPRSLPLLAPPPGLKDKILAQLDRRADASITGQPRSNRLRRNLWFGGLAAVASLIVALNWNLWVARRELHEREAQMAALQTEMVRQDQILRLLTDPQIHPVFLRGQPASPGSAGRLLWQPSAGTGMLLATGLPPPPPGKAYELWAIGKAPVPAGVFTVDSRGRAFHQLPKLSEAETFGQFAVTLEPAAGSLTPTSPILMAGSS
jgi:anti-sigma-K factor RskA